jgi:hypothetical protein
MTRRSILIAAVVVLAIAGGTAYVLWDRSPTSDATAANPVTPRPGVAPPPSAARTTDALLSADPQARRAALTPELAGVVGAAEELPAGSTITLDQDGWREHDGFAVATATVALPGQSARQIVIGFQRDGDRWLVAFEEEA